MPGTIRNFFATIDPVSPPPEPPRDLALRPNRSHRDETFKLELLRWRRRVLPPGLPAVRSKFQRHRLATQRPYARSARKDRRLCGGATRSSSGQILERFQAKWRPVRVKKTRQIKNLEPRFDSIETEKALGW